MSNCIVLVPAYSHITPATEEGLRELERRGYKVVRGLGCSAVDQVRNTLATVALNEKADQLFWIDSDIGFDPDDVGRLRGHDLPFVCGLYALRGGRRGMGANWKPDQGEVVFGRHGGLVEILSCCMGFACIKREVFERVQKKCRLPVCNIGRETGPMIPFFMPQVVKDDKGPWYLADDLSFCHRVRQAGFRIHVDTRIRLWHFGNHAFGWEDAGDDAQPRTENAKFVLR